VLQCPLVMVERWKQQASKGQQMADIDPLRSVVPRYDALGGLGCFGCDPPP